MNSILIHLQIAVLLRHARRMHYDTTADAGTRTTASCKRKGRIAFIMNSSTQTSSPINEPLHIVTSLLNGIDIDKHKAQPHSFDSASTRRSEERREKADEKKGATQQNGSLSSSPESGIGSEKTASPPNGMRPRSMSESTILPLKGDNRMAFRLYKR